MKPHSPELLVVAGEASGDNFAADVLSELAVPSFGIGGPALRAVGTRMLDESTRFSGMGFLQTALHLPNTVRSYQAVMKQSVRLSPAAALLVGFSEFNARLGRALRARGLRVLWYSPPQIWAWRPGRARKLAQCADRFCTILPFESEIWRAAGADVHYVGHPSIPPLGSTELPPPFSKHSSSEQRIALLPGSRVGELRRHLPLMLRAFAEARRVRPQLKGAALLASALTPESQRWAKAEADAAGVDTEPWALPRLRRFNAALACSGTVTADCIAARVPPVVVYRTDALSYAIARRLVRVPYIGLPNLVLGRRAFPELIQSEFTPELAATALGELLTEAPRYQAAIEDAYRGLAPRAESSARQVARLLEQLAASARRN